MRVTTFSSVYEFILILLIIIIIIKSSVSTFFFATTTKEKKEKLRKLLLTWNKRERERERESARKNNFSWVTWTIFIFFLLLSVYCGNAFKRWVTSSATATKTNSNWSWMTREKSMFISGEKHFSARFLTFVLTIFARWSRICSKVAAMLISRAPLQMRFKTMSRRI